MNSIFKTNVLTVLHTIHSKGGSVRAKALYNQYTIAPAQVRRALDALMGSGYVEKRIVSKLEVYYDLTTDGLVLCSITKNWKQ